ncbi:DUF7133 domain-containing protein [Robertkochia solimangrovi]|uniref:DUF7133 domain-containing protein n=1 Tax=Robertkochia solimangrovi TaxID=2213046 RepID=UPI0011805A3C|nr:PQQ-dependent sugar dehydrogenase [Robertkochia solimangrovi]TRZ46228.1 heme-binding domain protein [Robertkochia solimangrovi]
MKKFICFILLAIVLASCKNESAPSISSQNERFALLRDTTVKVYDSLLVMKLPIDKGVKIWNPGVLTNGPDNRIFGANLTGEIYSLEDTDGDGIEDKALLFCNVAADGFRTPAGMVFKDHDLYVGLSSQIRVYRDTDRDFVADTSFVFFDQIPYSDHPYEWTSGLCFDQEGWLYFVLTTDSWNPGASPDPEKVRGSLMRISPDGKTFERLATGLRSAHGMGFNKAGELYFVDNQGGQNPGEELNRYVKDGFYGHNTTKYGEQEVIPVVSYLETEVAPSDLIFRNENEQESLYVAFYGPGEYWERGGIARVEINTGDDGKETVSEYLLTDLPKVSNIAFSQEGHLYASRVGVTDYWYQKTDTADGAIYKIIKAPWITPDIPENKRLAAALDNNRIEVGRKLFNTRACFACHSLDGTTEMLGPDLKNIGLFYNREELLEEIKFPSKRIKPGSFASKITMENGEVQLGRVITQNEEELQLMLVGNQIKKIPVNEIESTELYSESMMYTGLLEDLTEEEINSLLDFLISNSK